MFDIDALFKIICLLLFMIGFDFINHNQLDKFEIVVALKKLI